MNTSMGEGKQQLPPGNEGYLESARYIPQELIGSHNNNPKTDYYCYLIELHPDFEYDVKPQHIVLAVDKMLAGDLNLDLEADRGKMIVHVKRVGKFTLTRKEVGLCRQFQVKLFDLLLKRNLDKHQHSRRNGSPLFNYLLVPALLSHGNVSVDWRCVDSVTFPENAASSFDHTKCSASEFHTKNGLVCRCMLENSLVRTPHNDVLYCITGTLDGVSGDTYFTPRDKERITYKEYFQQRGITLQYERENLLNGKRIFTVHNYLRCRIPKRKEPSYSSCELPPELCLIVMSPISISTFYSFSFLPTVMHRIESLLIAANLKSILAAGHCMQKAEIPANKVLEAITTKNCQEELHLESLETLGDSFLKYATSQQLFKTHQSRNEGFLTRQRQEIISNAALCKRGRDRKILGFIRDEPFHPKTWMIPCVDCDYGLLEEQIFASRKVYTRGSRQMKDKTVADVIEALIGAFLSAAGEKAALSFTVWLAIEVDLAPVPYTRMFPDMHVDITYLESRLGYSFRDASLLVEALTHRSYMRHEIPGCYQRLEFLGDAVLDYLITVHMYREYPDLSPGMLTDLRSASVNNDCYALTAIKAKLHKHILHRLPDLNRQIAETVDMFEELQSVETFGWESETTLPKVLGDVIESLAGAIFIDSGHDTEAVFRSMKALLEPLVTPDTLKLHPKRILNEVCQKKNYTMRKTVFCRHEGLAYATVEVEAGGAVHIKTGSAKVQRLAERLACKAVLNSLKESMDEEGADTTMGHGEPGPWLPQRIFLFFFVSVIFAIWWEICSSAYENSE